MIKHSAFWKQILLSQTQGLINTIYGLIQVYIMLETQIHRGYQGDVWTNKRTIDFLGATGLLIFDAAIISSVF